MPWAHHGARASAGAPAFFPCFPTVAGDRPPSRPGHVERPSTCRIDKFTQAAERRSLASASIGAQPRLAPDFVLGLGPAGSARPLEDKT